MPVRLMRSVRGTLLSARARGRWAPHILARSISDSHNLRILRGVSQQAGKREAPWVRAIRAAISSLMTGLHGG